MNLQFVSCNDYAELTAEITAGRGQSVDGQAMGVRVSGGSVSVSGSVANTDNIWYQEGITALAAGAVLTGVTRDTGIASAAATLRYVYFSAFVSSPQAGTLVLQTSHDSITWVQTATAPVTAGVTPTFLKTPVVARYQRAIFTNGSTATGTPFLMTTAYTVA